MSAVFVGQQLKIIWTLKDAVTGAVIDLTGETVKVLTRKPDGTETTENAEIEDAPAGQASYTWAADVLTKGEWAAKPYLEGSKTPGTVYRFDVSDKWAK